MISMCNMTLFPLDTAWLTLSLVMQLICHA